MAIVFPPLENRHFASRHLRNFYELKVWVLSELVEEGCCE